MNAKISLSRNTNFYKGFSTVLLSFTIAPIYQTSAHRLIRRIIPQWFGVKWRGSRSTPGQQQQEKGHGSRPRARHSWEEGGSWPFTQHCAVWGYFPGDFSTLLPGYCYLPLHNKTLLNVVSSHSVKEQYVTVFKRKLHITSTLPNVISENVA